MPRKATVKTTAKATAEKERKTKAAAEETTQEETPALEEAATGDTAPPGRRGSARGGRYAIGWGPVEALNAHNKNTSPLTVNSMYVLDDEKQRDKMADEFYTAVRKEIETYQEKVQHLIQAYTQSVAVMDRWVRKIDGLEEKKRRYEELLSRELDRLNDDFETLRMFSQELQVRARKIEMRKSA